MKGKGYVAMLAVLYGAAFLAGFNENLVNMGLMSIMRDFSIDSVTAQWLVTGYMIVATVVVMSMAFLYRRIKLRLLFFIGAALTAVGSLMGLLAMNYPFLLVARLVQAAGAGLFIPLMMNTILIVAPKHRLGTFMSIGGCMITFGPALAPVVCGGLVTAFGWHSIFTVPLAAMALLAAAGAFVLSDVENTDAHLDAVSVVLSAAFLFTLSFGLAQLTITPVAGVASLAAAVASAAVFVLRQLRIDHPLIDMSPMCRSTFWPAIVLVVVAMTITFSLSVILPLYFEGAMGMSAFMAGIVILIPVLVNAGCTLLGGRIMDARGEWPLLPLGMLCMLVGVIGLAVAAPTLSIIAMFVSALFAYAGVGLTFSPSQTAGLRTLPPEQNPFGVALMTTFVQVAACIGPSMFIGVMSSAQAAASTAGAVEGLATARGFSAAAAVAAVVAGIGFVCAFVYALFARRNAARRAVAADIMPAGDGVVAVAGGSMAAEGAAAWTGAAAPAGLADATVASVMQREPYTLSSGTLVREAMRSLVEHRVSGMPIVDDEGRAVGYVSDGDIMRYLADQHPLVTSSYALIEAANNRSMDERLNELMELPVMAIATEKVVTLGAGTPLKDACQLLAQHRLKKVPVTSGGRVVGTVNRSDVLRMAMRTYLSGEEPVA